MFDGLDEAPEHQKREHASRLFEHATAEYKKCRFVVTTRPQSYVGGALLAGFHKARIEPLDQEAVHTFLDRWCRGIYPESRQMAEQHRDELAGTLRAVPEIRKMTRNPVMLTALAVVHWNEKRIPEQRADLYDSILVQTGQILYRSDPGHSLQPSPFTKACRRKHALESERSGGEATRVSGGVCVRTVEMTELCRLFGITRPTGYAVLRRYGEQGEAGLQERSRAPRWHPNQTAREIEEQVVELRREHMRWGPRTLKARLERLYPEVAWPAASTIGALLDREGLTSHRKKRRKVAPYTRPLAAATEANRVWCADFKGWFRTQDGERIDPLTISDAHSRYLLRCQAVEVMDTTRVQAIFEAAFRECGMPEAIRTDNGPPFASRAIGGLSRLAVWWMKLGIVAERIEAGHPEQNGRHERMHRTLAEETASPPQATRRAQQRAFDRFQREYNEERPHQALGMQTPAAVWVPSSREYPVCLPEPEYGRGMQVRRVDCTGHISWKHHSVFLSDVLIGERVGLLPVDERHYEVYFVNTPLARFDSYRLCMHRLASQKLAGRKNRGGNVEISKAEIPTFPPHDDD